MDIYQIKTVGTTRIEMIKTYYDFLMLFHEALPIFNPIRQT